MSHDPNLHFICRSFARFKSAIEREEDHAKENLVANSRASNVQLPEERNRKPSSKKSTNVLGKRKQSEISTSAQKFHTPSLFGEAVETLHKRTDLRDIRAT